MSILATVDGDSISVAEALRRSILHEENFLQNSVDWLLLQKYAARTGITVTDGELQLAADEMRYMRGLESVEKVNQWIKANNQTALSLQNTMEGMLRRNKIRNAIPESEIAAYFAEHQLEFEAVDLYSIRVSTKDKADELASQISESGANFHVLAMEHSEDAETRHLGGYAGRLRRGGMSGEVEAAVFGARPGQIIGPVKTEKGYNLFKVAAVHRPKLAEARDEVQYALFANLLAKLRSEAGISYPVLQDESAATL